VAASRRARTFFEETGRMYAEIRLMADSNSHAVLGEEIRERERRSEGDLSEWPGWGGMMPERRCWMREQTRKFAEASFALNDALAALKKAHHAYGYLATQVGQAEYEEQAEAEYWTTGPVQDEEDVHTARSYDASYHNRGKNNMTKRAPAGRGGELYHGDEEALARPEKKQKKAEETD
jgi:hypothetical protein